MKLQEERVADGQASFPFPTERETEGTEYKRTYKKGRKMNMNHQSRPRKPAERKSTEKKSTAEDAKTNPQ